MPDHLADLNNHLAQLLQQTMKDADPVPTARSQIKARASLRCKRTALGKTRHPHPPRRQQPRYLRAQTSQAEAQGVHSGSPSDWVKIRVVGKK
jgi:hypothetical protein